jgi:hypothetical protein
MIFKSVSNAGMGKQVSGKQASGTHVFVTCFLLLVYFIENKNLSGSKRQVHSGKLVLIFQNSLLPELAP